MSTSCPFRVPLPMATLAALVAAAAPAVAAPTAAATGEHAMVSPPEPAATGGGAGDDELALLQVHQVLHGTLQRVAQNDSPCGEDGYGPDLSDCHKYWQCDEWGQTFNMACGPGTVWNNDLRTCDWGECSEGTTAASAATQATTTTQAACIGESCGVYSDPHVSTFDARGRGLPDYLKLIQTDACSHRPVDVNAYGTGNFWIVKARDLQVQGRFVHSQEFVPDRAALGAVVVAGPALQGQELLLEPMSGRVAWARRTVAEPVHLDANQTDGLLELTSYPGPQPGSHYVEAALPRGVRLVAVRFNRHLDMKLTMPKALGARDGLCGNGNGIEDDDAEGEVRARLGSLSVAPDELLFEDGKNS